MPKRMPKRPRRKVSEDTIKRILELNRQPLTIKQIAKIVGLSEGRVRNIIREYAGGRPKEVIGEIVRSARARAKPPRRVTEKRTLLDEIYYTTLRNYVRSTTKEIRERLEYLREELEKLDKKIMESSKPMHEQPKEIIAKRNNLLMEIRALEDILKIRGKRS